MSTTAWILWSVSAVLVALWALALERHRRELRSYRASLGGAPRTVAAEHVAGVLGRVDALSEELEQSSLSGGDLVLDPDAPADHHVAGEGSVVPGGLVLLVDDQEGGQLLVDHDRSGGVSGVVAGHGSSPSSSDEGSVGADLEAGTSHPDAAVVLVSMAVIGSAIWALVGLAVWSVLS